MSYLRDLLGEQTLLLHWPLGRKATKRKWGHLTSEIMNDPAYLERLEKGNIGVALGEKSCGLCAIDIDLDELVEPVVQANVHINLKDTLRTRGARGAVFWVRFVGNYPQKTFLLKTRTDDDAGEFRSTGSQSIIAGIHPDTKKPYTIIVPNSPLTIEYSSIRWPIEFQKFTDEEGRKEGTSLRSLQISMSSVSSTSSTLHPREPEIGKDIERAIAMCIPADPHQNHKLLFKLARALKAVENSRGIFFEQDELDAAFDKWYEHSIKSLRSGQSRDDYLFEFLDGWERVKYPLGEGVLEMAWDLARSSPLPTDIARVKSEQTLRLIVFCRELQRLVGDRSFYLSSRTVQRLFNLEHPTQAWRQLDGLCKLRILTLTKRGIKHANGQKGETNEYRYLPPIAEAGSEGESIL